MKGRTMKLKEAHKNPNGKKSFCSIIWDLQAQHLFTSSSSDNSISVHDLLQPSNPPKSLGDHTAGVTALALSPDSKCLASGSVDRSVKIYSYPGWVYKRSITRFTLAIRSVAFNKSGSMLAAAGDDDGIKLINMVDFSISRVLKGHKGSVTGLAFDPNGDYLASIDSTGNVIIWELSSGKQLHNLKGVATNFGYETSVPNVLSWSPDGECLAVPGSFNDVVMYDRDTAKVVFKIQGEHENNVCFVSWSPNGEYIATSGFDNQVMIWEINSKKKEVINNQRFDCRICCLAWKPNGNALAVIDEMGKYGVWDSVVPIQMKSPSDGAPSHKGSRLSHIEDDGDDQPSNSGNLNDVGDDCCNESEPVGRKRFRKYQLYEDMDEDSNDQVGSLHKVEPRKKAFRNLKEGLNNGVRDQSIMRSIAPEMQEAFQPGSTPVQAGTRRFLCYNMLGSITTIENAGNSHIEVDFHDTGRRSRVPKMTDYFGFTMAALNENGSVFANPCKGEKNMSTLMYRPFSSWANNSEWSMRFKGEEVKVVALGTGWVAAVTSLNYLRIFTEGGLQRYIISLDGPVVTASGFKDELAVVTHASHPLPSYGQMLEFEVFKISQLFNRSQPFKRSLPLTPGSRLTWFGFSEEGRLSSYDSKGVLRAFTNAYWVPLFSASEEKDSASEEKDSASKEEDIAIEEKDTASKEKDSNSEEKKSDSYWIVGLNAIKLFCITCKSPNSYPLVSPKPVLTLFDLSFPLASSDLGADDLEKEFIFSDLYKSQTEIKIDEMIAAGLDTTREEDEAFELEASLDRCIIRLIGVCCTGDKLVRATELARLLTHEKSLKGCIKLATTLKLPALAERFNAILEERLLNEAMEITSRPSLTPNVEQPKNFEHPQPIKIAEDTLPSSKKPSTTFQRPGKAESRGDKTEAKRSTSEKNVKERVNPPSRALNNQDSLSIGRSTSINAGAEKIKEGGSTVQAQRPSNPFAKKSTKEENKPSVFDTITILKAKANNGSKH